MSTKLYDIVAKVGSYTNNEGVEKGRYENAGSVMEKDGGKFIVLKRTFNPAGVPNPDNKDSIILSLFEVDNNSKPQQNQNQNQQSYQNGTSQQQGYQNQSQYGNQSGGYNGR